MHDRQISMSCERFIFGIHLDIVSLTEPVPVEVAREQGSRGARRKGTSLAADRLAAC